MKVTTTNEFDFENEELTIMCQSDDPNGTPRPEEDDETIEPDDEEDDEEIIKPYN
ncbi:hypothetical protein C8N46_112132 [Kordia periserrulae]|uniref:Uncharacterized protein n=1 Tax=Kordia periserrulae TaxID=701523 RepID=A0A2T6BRZ8_9FLAO|nr:hypothetical protein [Kordia periserrulae]PTX58824.1 hypothetical protein C8N46_112132 [Kordia periserrulae]